MEKQHAGEQDIIISELQRIYFGEDGTDAFLQMAENHETSDHNDVAELILQTLGENLPLYLAKSFGKPEQYSMSNGINGIKNLFAEVEKLWKSNVKRTETEPSAKTSKLIDCRNKIMSELAQLIKMYLHNYYPREISDVAVQFMDYCVADPFSIHGNSAKSPKTSLFYQHQAKRFDEKFGYEMDEAFDENCEDESQIPTLFAQIQELIKTRKIFPHKHRIGNFIVKIEGDNLPNARSARKERICTIEIVPAEAQDPNDEPASLVLNLDRKTGRLNLGRNGKTTLADTIHEDVENEILAKVIPLIAENLKMQKDENDIEDEDVPAVEMTEIIAPTPEISETHGRPRKPHKNHNGFNQLRGVSRGKILRAVGRILKGRSFTVRNNGGSHNVIKLRDGRVASVPSQHTKGGTNYPALAALKGIGVSMDRIKKEL